ncbi:MAG: hypothetical protein HY303_18935, partial [Candidatus Wallbacteria bacterium]|nr:hypothetical protein [Candidatus Wallbacteria bacterium]
PSDLRRLYPRGEEVALERAGQVTKLLAVSARDVAALQGWLLAPSVAEGGRLLDEELGPVDWWLGSARIPRAGAYEFRVTGSGSVGLKLGRWAVERGNRQACASGVFLEGYCPLAIADSQGHAGRPPEVWWRSPVWGGQWRRLPDCAVRRGLIGQPTQRPGGAWIAGPGEDDPTRAQVEPGLLAESMPSGHGLRIGVRADTSIAPLSWDTWETGIRASPPFVWVLRWLPVPLWRFRLDGAVASPPAASGAATYRGRPVYADPIPSASIELDGPDGVIMSDPGMRKLVRLSTASPKWQVWPQDGEVQNPVSLSRLPGSGWLAVGHSRGLMVLDAAGRIVRDWEGRPPADVACDSADRICQLLPFEGVIAVCDASGAELGRWRCSELTPESRLAIDRQDRLWVLTPETGEVLVFSGSGELLAPPTRIVSRRIADSRGLVHREEPPGDIDCGPDGVLRVLLDGRLLTLSP